MTINSKTIRFLTNSLTSLAICAAISIAMSLPAVSADQPLIFVINIDVMPPFTADAGKLLKTYRANSIKEKGAKRIELLQRLEHGNHFAIIEEWSTQADYDTHVSTEETRNFRTKIQPMLGSPFDERVHHTFE